MSFDIDLARRIGDLEITARFAVEAGLTALVGPSGAGKSTVLAMIAGLMRPDRGRVRVDGETLFDRHRGIDLPPNRRRLGIVFQDGRLFPHRRVHRNLLYGYDLAPRSARWLAPEDAIQFLGIGHLLDRWPRSLSGGEAQRVAIGRALLSGPRALLMDEPLSSLDQARRAEIMLIIERIRDELKLPILYVTHDPAEVTRLATQQVMIGV